jgi:hypothetical protein
VTNLVLAGVPAHQVNKQVWPRRSARVFILTERHFKSAEHKVVASFRFPVVPL